MIELNFDPESVKNALRQSMLSHTVKVFSGPEGWSDPDCAGMDEDVENAEQDASESSDGEEE